MKIMKSYQHLMPLVGIPLLMISGVILYFPHVAVQLFKIHWLVLLAALVVACGPWGKRRLAMAEEMPRYSRPAWLAQIISLQLCLGAIFLGISVVCGQTAPVLTTPHPHIFQSTLRQLLVSEGLFPWAFFALMAVRMGYCSYCRQEDAYLATALRLMYQHRSVAVTINFIGRFATFLAYGSTFGLISLLWASMDTTSPPHHRICLNTLTPHCFFIIDEHHQNISTPFKKMAWGKITVNSGLIFVGVLPSRWHLADQRAFSTSNKRSDGAPPLC